MDELAGRVAVITGGASGIGLAMAERFAVEGMRLVIADIEQDALDAAAKQLADGGTEVLAVRTDVSKADDVDALADRVRERFGAFHVVCNNAGVGGHGFATSEGPVSEWQWVLGVNLWGVIHGIRAFVPALVKQNEGHVVNTASVAALAGTPFMGPYTASKHAVLAISEALYHELTMQGSSVEVSVLCPDVVNTRIVDSRRNWPSHLGPEPENEHPAREVLEQVVRDAIAAGMEPAQLAEQVLDAVRTGRFMVLTDSEAASTAVKHRLAETEGNAPTFPTIF